VVAKSKKDKKEIQKIFKKLKKATSIKVKSIK
jgi:hypothetical protein